MPKQYKGKTLSRKAQARLSARSDSPSSVHEAFADFDPARTALRNALSLQSSRAGSPAPDVNSRRHSRPVSHTNSSDDDGDEDVASFTDDTVSSFASHEDLSQSYQNLHEIADDMLEQHASHDSESGDVTKSALEEQLRNGSLLQETVDELLDAKHRHWKHGNQGRERCLMRYCFLLANHYDTRGLDGREEQLCVMLLGSLHWDCEAKETVLALRAFDLTAITSSDTDLYTDATPQLKLAISDSESAAIKTAALASFALVSFLADLDDEELLSNMAFLLEIVTSDGSFINALHEPRPVVAAMDAYALLATEVEDLSEHSEEAMETFTEQLSSTNVPVKIAAAECIALLFEKSYTEVEEDDVFRRTHNPEDPNDGEASGAAIYEGDNVRPTLVRRYFAYRHRERLEAELQEMATTAYRHISKKEKRALSGKLEDVRRSIQNPLHGPNYRAVLSDSSVDTTGKGSAIRASTSDKSAFLKLDKWWQIFRHRVLRHALKDRGMMEHLEKNPAVSEILPVPVSQLESMLVPKNTRNRIKTYKAKAGMKTMPRVSADRSMLELDGVDY